MSGGDLGYRGVQRASLPWLRSVWAIFRSNIRMILRYRVFWGIMVLSMLHFLVHYVLIYVKAQIALQGGWFAEVIDRFQVTGNGEAITALLPSRAAR